MKKFKKVLAILMVAAFAACALAACGGSNAATTEAGTAPAGTAAPAQTAAPVEATSDIVAGLICLHDENSTYDLNFINAFKESCEAIGLVQGETYFIVTGIPEGQECYEQACNLVEDYGCNYVFADSFGHEDFMIQAAKEFPEVQFCHATGTKAHTAGLGNYHNAFASIYDGRYLAGIAAGMKLNEMIEAGEFKAEEAKMGYVGAYTYAEVISGYTSFFLGARSVCPTVTMDVTFTGSWYDETLEKEGANTLIGRGCKLISQHADSYGAPTACEAAGVPNVSYNGSTISVGANTYIVTSRVYWAPYYSYCFDCLMNGEPIAADWTGTLATDSVQCFALNEAAAAKGTQEAIDAARADLESGKIHVYDTKTFTVDGKELTSYMADVDTDEAFTGDTEVIVDGYFHESEFRSAPYFDLQIDGIELLDTAM